MVTSIPLTQGQFALVDDDDAPLVSQFHWYAHKGRNSNCWYARSHTPRGQGPRQTIRLHRHILSAAKGEMVDHVNGDGLDCRRKNMRIATPVQNAYNRRVRRDSISGVKGVRKRGARWLAHIKVGGKLRHIGAFDTIEEAAAARDAQAKIHHGEFACFATDRR